MIVCTILQEHEVFCVEFSAKSALRRQVPPCVLSACVHTPFNGWATARRFQSEAPCVCCKSSGSDSIEHYWCCPVLLEAGRRHLHLHLSSWSFHDVLLCSLFRPSHKAGSLHVHCSYTIHSYFQHQNSGDNVHWVYGSYFRGVQKRT